MPEISILKRDDRKDVVEIEDELNGQVKVVLDPKETERLRSALEVHLCSTDRAQMPGFLRIMSEVEELFKQHEEGLVTLDEVKTKCLDACIRMHNAGSRAVPL